MADASTREWCNEWMHRKEGRTTPAEFMITPTVTWADVDVDDEAMRTLTTATRDLAATPSVIHFVGANRRQRRLAAEAMAHALDRPLLRIDLGAVDSAWIKETEPNLNRIFTAAVGADALLFFDEADALLGKRPEVKDSHDRFSAEAVSHLLSRIDDHSAPCIVATNAKQNLDPAFVRRLRAQVNFPRR